MITFDQYGLCPPWSDWRDDSWHKCHSSSAPYEGDDYHGDGDVVLLDDGEDDDYDGDGDDDGDHY